MIIRAAQKEDAAFLFSCAAAAFGDYILLIGRTPGPMLEDYYEGICRHHCFVAEGKDGPCGFSLLKDGEGEILWLDVLAVLPTASGNGIGRALLAHMEDYMQRLGKRACRVYTHVKYTRTLALYERAGFSIYTRVQEDGFDRYYLQKILPAPKR